MKSEKEKLQAKTVDQLKRYAKKVGAKIVTPDGKAKTKVQLVNSIIMAQRLGKKAPAGSVSKLSGVYYVHRALKESTNEARRKNNRLSAGPVSPAKAKALQKKRDVIRKYIDEIIEVGPNYAVWQNAQGAYKNARAIEKLLRNW